MEINPLRKPVGECYMWWGKRRIQQIQLTCVDLNDTVWYSAI